MNFLNRRLRRPAQARRARPQLETLEDRTVPATYFVSPAGADVAGGGGAANPFRSIQYAVNRAAPTGDTIQVAAGAYTYNAAADTTAAQLGTTAVVVVFNKQLIIKGGYNAANWAAAPDPVANPTVIDGQGSTRGVLVIGIDPTKTAAAIDLENFTVQNGLGLSIPARGGDDAIFAFGGGAFIDLGSQQNTAAAQVFRNVVFRFNAAVGANGGDFGGGGGGGGLALRYAGHVYLDTVTFQNNRAAGGNGTTRGGGAFGGGLQADHSQIISAANVAFVNNVASGGAGAGAGVTLDGQRADALGGAAALQNASSMTAASLTVTGNAALGGNAVNQAGGGYGGGVMLEGASLTVTDGTFASNLALGGTGRNEAVVPKGGTTAVQGGGSADGGGLMVYGSNLSLNRVSVTGNLARGGASTSAATTGFFGSPAGGGLFLASFDTTPHAAVLVNAVVTDNRIDFNTAGLATRPDSFNMGGGGGGLWIQGLPTQIMHATIAGNTLGPNLYYGSGVLLNPAGAAPGTTTAAILFSIIANETNPSGNAALQVWGDGVANLARVLFANDTKPTTNSGPPGITPGTINGFDPSLVGPSAGFVAPGSDYHILNTSPAKNQATGSTITVDRDNRPRSGVPDLGAYEVPPPQLQFAATHFDTFDSSASVTVTVTRTGNSDGPSTVTLWTGGGTATPGTDYNAIAPTVVTFNPGDTSKTVSIILHNTTSAATIRTFNVFLGNPSGSGASLGAQSSAVVNLVDDQGGDLAQFIGGTYHTLLNRAVDPASFVAAYNTLYPAFVAALTGEATGFLSSKEYYFTLVRSTYSAFLGRTPSSGELDAWANRALATSVEQMIAEIAGSGEAIAHSGGTAGAWLNVAFQGLLGRPVDSGALAALSPLLKPGQPATFVNLAFVLTQSQEYRTKLVNDDYQAFLGRAPFASEAAYVASLVNLLATQPRQVVAAALVTSPEYYAAAGNTVATWVGRLYTNLLGHPADTTGAAAHENAILNGFLPQRDAFVNGILNGTEYRTLLIQNTFQQILRHPPSAGQVTEWLSHLAGGMTVEQFKATLFSSPEYLQTQAASDPATWLNQLYLDALGRPIDAGASSALLGLLNGGMSRQTLAGALLATDEYFDRLTGVYYTQVLGRSPSPGEVTNWRSSWKLGMRDQRFLDLLLTSSEYYGDAHPYP
jgi:hypothetical protein